MTGISMTLSSAEHHLLQKLLATALDEVREDLRYIHFTAAYREKRQRESQIMEQLLERIAHVSD